MYIIKIRYLLIYYYLSLFKNAVKYTTNQTSLVIVLCVYSPVGEMSEKSSRLSPRSQDKFRSRLEIPGRNS